MADDKVAPYGHCSGCNDPDPLGGTHCEGTIEHPLVAPSSEPSIPSREPVRFGYEEGKGVVDYRAALGRAEDRIAELEGALQDVVKNFPITFAKYAALAAQPKVKP